MQTKGFRKVGHSRATRGSCRRTVLRGRAGLLRSRRLPRTHSCGCMGRAGIAVCPICCVSGLRAARHVPTAEVSRGLASATLLSSVTQSQQTKLVSYADGGAANCHRGTGRPMCARPPPLLWPSLTQGCSTRRAPPYLTSRQHSSNKRPPPLLSRTLSGLVAAL